MAGLQFDEHIALVGMPGAGKSTVGRLLAQKLGRAFFDSDQFVVRETGRSIEDIFSSDGQAIFRSMERDAITRALAGPPAIVATGGGAMVEPPTRALLLDRALTIWLDVPPEILALRLATAPPRPLLTGPNMAARLSAMAEQRRPDYTAARLHVAAYRSPRTVCAQIVAALASL